MRETARCRARLGPDLETLERKPREHADAATEAEAAVSNVRALTNRARVP